MNREQDTIELFIIVGVAAFALATGTLVSLGRRRGRAAGGALRNPYLAWVRDLRRKVADRRSDDASQM